MNLGVCRGHNRVSADRSWDFCSTAVLKADTIMGGIIMQPRGPRHADSGQPSN